MNDSAVRPRTLSAQISPRGGLDVLSRQEVSRLRDASSGGMRELLRRCALAVLTTGSTSDDPRAALERYPDFDLELVQHDRGIKLSLHNAPELAFVDGRIIDGVAELLFAVVRDIALMAGVAPGACMLLPLDRMEQTFERLAAVAEGRPVLLEGLPDSTVFAAALLILREFMHHLGFSALHVRA